MEVRLSAEIWRMVSWVAFLSQYGWTVLQIALMCWAPRSLVCRVFISDLILIICGWVDANYEEIQSYSWGQPSKHPAWSVAGVYNLLQKFHPFLLMIFLTIEWSSKAETGLVKVVRNQTKWLQNIFNSLLTNSIQSDCEGFEKLSIVFALNRS